MSCKKCNRDKKIVNKHFYLCQECNNERLHGNKYGKQYKLVIKEGQSFKTTPRRRGRKKGSLFAPKIKSIPKREKDYSRQDEKIRIDEEFYKKCFDNSNHKCEECGEDLPTIFRNEEGRVVARWRYSHIIPKSIAPELRHSIKNINHLCLIHHSEWENGDKEKMKIYKENRERFPGHFD